LIDYASLTATLHFTRHDLYDMMRNNENRIHDKKNTKYIARVYMSLQESPNVVSDVA
jgi:hypothetical protein